MLPTLVTYDDEGKPYTVRYSLLTPLLLNEIQRQAAEIARLRRQEAELRQQRDELEELRNEVRKLSREKRFRSD